jgi:hypothetical protein
LEVDILKKLGLHELVNSHHQDHTNTHSDPSDRRVESSSKENGVVNDFGDDIVTNQGLLNIVLLLSHHYTICFLASYLVNIDSGFVFF